MNYRKVAPAAVATVLVATLLAGCRPGPGAITIDNRTGLSLDVVHRSVPSAVDLAPGEREQVSLITELGECSPTTFFVVDEDGYRVARLDPPICDEQVWVVHEADLRAPTDQEITECLGEDLEGLGLSTASVAPGERAPCTDLD